jgi:hypothetical protein
VRSSRRASEDAGGGWVRLDVTNEVRAWLGGNLNNNGVALFASEPGPGSHFWSAAAPREENCPKLELTYAPERGGADYKYGFEKQIDGNCMSYALRDTAMILYDDLFDTAAFQKIYDAGGPDASLRYVKKCVLDYMLAHRDALGLASVRELDGFDAALTTPDEYRIALRIGFRDRSAPEGIQVEEDFDYHFWVEVSEGRWAEKTPAEPSRLVPGTNRDTDPGAYPWHQGYMWGYEKWNDYYTGAVVYFAVAKTTDAFTTHKPVTAE